MKKISIVFYLVFISLGLFAQGKIYLEPYLGFFVGLSKPNKEINRNQNIIQHYYYGGKDFVIGGKLSYQNKLSKISIGYEPSFYTSNYKRNETGLPRINWKSSTGYGPFNSIYAEYARQSFNLNVKMPKSFEKWLTGDNEKLYLISSKISPVLGIEYRFVYNGFINDENIPRSTIQTSQGNYRSDVQYLHLNANANITLRGGVNWEFFNGEKHKFTLAFLYKFAFKDAGYIQYRFKSVNNVNPAIDYQNTTRGNGFCIYLGVPIKLFTFKKK